MPTFLQAHGVVHHVMKGIGLTDAIDRKMVLSDLHTSLRLPLHSLVGSVDSRVRLLSILPHPWLG